MTILPVNISSSLNKNLNFLCRQLEFVAVFILFICLFDIDLDDFTKIFNIASYGILLCLLVLRWKRCVYVATRDISLLLLVGIVIISYLWSASPEDTLVESKSYVRSVLIGVYLAAQFNPKQLMQLLTAMFGITLVMNWVYISFAIATHQDYRVIAFTNNEPSWIGMLTHKQYLGRMMLHASILFLLGALTNKRWRKIMLLGLGFSGVLLYRARSKTSWAGFLIALSLLPILKFAKYNYKFRTILYIIGVVIVGSILVVTFSNLETILVDIFHKPPDFSGRFEIWQPAIESALKRPWLGYGYSGFWTSSESHPIIIGTWARSSGNVRFHSHNGFIDVILQIGFIGFSLFVFNFLATLKRVINLIHFTYSIESFWMLEFMIIAFLQQLTETLALMSTSTMCSIYIAIVLSTILWEYRLKKLNYQ